MCICDTTWPSGFSLCNAIAPRMPEAPALFSTTTVWPSFFDTDSPRIRKPISAGPPGAQGTIRRIGFSGNLAIAGAASVTAAAPIRAVRRVMRFMVLKLPNGGIVAAGRGPSKPRAIQPERLLWQAEPRLGGDQNDD